MPIHRGQRLDDMIARLPGCPIPLQAGIIKTFPNLATGISTPNNNTWVEYISAVNAPASPFTVMLAGHQNGAFDGRPESYVEVGIGGVGAEVAIACAQVAGTGNGYHKVWPYPRIPGGTRVCLRIPASGSTEYRGSVLTSLLPTPTNALTILRSIPKMVDSGRGYGGASALMVHNGVACIGGAGLGTYSAYAQTYAAGTETVPVLLTAISFQSFDNWYEAQFCIGYGGAGSETAFIEFPMGYLAGGPAWVHNFDLPVPILIPATSGSSPRFAIRVASAVGDGFGRGGFTIMRSIYQP